MLNEIKTKMTDSVRDSFKKSKLLSLKRKIDRSVIVDHNYVIELMIKVNYWTAVLIIIKKTLRENTVRVAGWSNSGCCLKIQMEMK